MKKRGFTLIELLAVIVILAVIAVIATPIILNMIGKARKSAFQDSAYGIIESARLFYAENILDGGMKDDQTFLFDDGKPSGLTFSGSKPEGGILQLTRTGEISLAIHNGTWCATKSKTESKVTLTKYEEGKCMIPDTAKDPIIKLKGEKEITLKIGETYHESGAEARTVDGNDLTYTTVITLNGEVVSQVETNTVGSIYKIIYTAESNGKSASVERTVTIIDGSGPVITFNPETVTLESEEVNDYNILTGVTVTDLTDGTIDTSLIKTTGNLSKTPGTYSITYEATNSNGTKASKTRTFIVEDRTKPNIVINPNEENNFVKMKTITITATDNIQLKQLKYALIKDDVKGTETVISSGDTVTINENGNYQIEVTAIDGSDNRNTITSGVYKIDTEPPVITAPIRTSVKITEAATYDIYEGVSATDNSGETPTITSTGDLRAELGEYTVTYKATDQAGNEGTATRIFTVVEAEGPVLNFSDIGSDTWRKATTITIYATDNSNLSSFTYEILKDGVSLGIENVSVSGKSAEKEITFDQDGTYQIKLTGSDEHGNTNTATSSTYKIDATAPTAGTVNISGTLGNNGWYTSNVTITPVNGSDALSGHKTTTSNVSTITSNTSGKVVTITTTDQAGNSASRNYTIKVDKTAPTLTLKDTGSATITEGDNITVSSYYNTPTYSISGGSMSCSPTNTSGLAAGTRAVTCTATGGNGLSTSINKTVIVKVKGVSIADKMNDSSETMTNDPDGNRRYVGSDPNNYVKFNNELWRIIGVFNGQAKIIRNSSYSINIAWDRPSSGGGHGSYGWNDWSQSTLQTELNGTYLNSIDSTYKNMIDESHVWNLGGGTGGTRSQFYSFERGSSVYSGRPTTWTGAIGLMYPSDWAYATSGTTNACDNSTLLDWSLSGSASYCRDNSWLTPADWQWTLTPGNDYVNSVFYVTDGGNVGKGDASNTSGCLPSLYLKSSVKIKSGTGSSTDPFELIME